MARCCREKNGFPSGKRRRLSNLERIIVFRISVIVHKLLEFLEGKGAVGLDILNTFHDEPLSQSCICLAFFLTMYVVGDWFCSLSMTIKLSRFMPENRSPIKRSNIYCIEMRVLHPLDDPARGPSGGIKLPPSHIEMPHTASQRPSWAYGGNVCVARRAIEVYRPSSYGENGP